MIEVFKKVGVQLTREDLKVLPWARSYYEKLLDTPGTALFSMTYTEERLKNFQFVGPIIPTQVLIIAPVAKHLKVADAADLKALKIGVIRDDIGDQLVRAFGAEDIAKYQFILAGMDPKEHESVHVLQKSYMGHAFHKSTDPRDGRLRRRLRPYLRIGHLRAAGLAGTRRPLRADAAGGRTLQDIAGDLHAAAIALSYSPHPLESHQHPTRNFSSAIHNTARAGL